MTTIRKNAKKAGPETTVSEEVTAYLTQFQPYLFFWNQEVSFVQIEDRKFMSGLPGTADLIVCFMGRFVVIETKAPGKRLRPKQKKFRDAVLKAGGVHIIGHSVEAVRSAFELHGFIKKLMSLEVPLDSLEEILSSAKGPQSE